MQALFSLFAQKFCILLCLFQILTTRYGPPTTKGQKAPKRLAVRRVCPCESTLTWLNDFIFCPASIYFHNLYGTVSSVSFQDVSQINGSDAHRRLDSGKYSTRKTLLSGISVYSEKYNLIIFPFNFYCCR